MSTTKEKKSSLPALLSSVKIMYFSCQFYQMDMFYKSILTYVFIMIETWKQDNENLSIK